jgi:MoaA/NifB/PqqE/SkfB family radical SAM enzyme
VVAFLPKNPDALDSLNSIPQAQSPIVTSARRRQWLKLLVYRQILGLLWNENTRPLAALRKLRRTMKLYKEIFGEEFIAKAAFVGGRYYWRLAGPGFPSLANRICQQNELTRFLGHGGRVGLRSLILGITKKCPLQCEHCYEWNKLGHGERISRESWLSVIHKYQKIGTTQMVFSGGEPMLRFKDLIYWLQNAGPGTDFWIVTSGLQADNERLKALKEAGLTGILVSIDHHLEKEHDRFRGFDGAYRNAVRAAREAKSLGLVTALSLCSTQSYTTWENLVSYMRFARQLGVSFVQIFEPKAAGRYAGKSVELAGEQLETLERLYHTFNTGKAWADYPIVNYLGYHSRRLGCFGGGDRFFYIDTDGRAMACPFCDLFSCDAIELSAEVTLDGLSRVGCSRYRTTERALMN